MTHRRVFILFIYFLFLANGRDPDVWLVRRGFSILPELSEEELDEIAEVFRLLDDDDSGALDADELLEGFSLMGSRVDETELRALIRAVDFDGSGEIELDEFEVIMGSKKQFAKLKGIDENGEEQEPGSSDDDDAEDEFNSTWARGLRRKKMISAIEEGGESRIRMVRLANEAEEETKMAKLEEAAAREAEEARDVHSLVRSFIGSFIHWFTRRSFVHSLYSHCHSLFCTTQRVNVCS